MREPAKVQVSRGLSARIPYFANREFARVEQGIDSPQEGIAQRVAIVSVTSVVGPRPTKPVTESKYFVRVDRVEFN
jgi:hypothetical protein